MKVNKIIDALGFHEIHDPELSMIYQYTASCKDHPRTTQSIHTVRFWGKLKIKRYWDFYDKKSEKFMKSYEKNTHFENKNIKITES